MNYVKIFRLLLTAVFVFNPVSFNFSSMAQESAPVELNGDQIEFKSEEHLFIAEGNVSVVQDDVALYADQMQYNRLTKDTQAEGHVMLESSHGDVWAKSMNYNFLNQTGEFHNARIIAHPYYGVGRKISKLSETHYVLEDGFLTTSDYDNPGYRVESDRIDLILDEKAVARRSIFKVGKVPLMYIPKYSHDLRDGRPRVRVTPGYSGDYGAFLLTAWRYELNKHLNGRILMDYRERKDFASGINGEYKIAEGNTGVFRTYYMNERSIGDNHIWDERLTPTIERERYRAEIRHKWKIDSSSQFIGQYYNLSDRDFIKDYFETEYREDTNPDTYFVYTKALKYGTLSVRSDVRVNRFETKVERLPEVQYSLANQPLGDTGFYWKTTNTFSNLDKKYVSPSDNKPRTMRFSTDNELSKPFKWAFLELRPFVGTEYTYFEKGINVKDDHTIRGLFKTGLDVSTKFYRIFDVHSDLMGIEINRLRHVITPSAKYLYQHEPTHLSSTFNQFDSIDSRSQQNSVVLSLENKLQTKREEQNIDLLRFIIDVPFYFSSHPGQASWGDIDLDLDFRPVNYLTFYADAEIDSDKERFDDFNIDLQAHDPDRNKWSAGIGKRWSRQVDDQVTTSFQYILNPKWKFSTYHRFDLDSGVLKEQEYSITRDLHSWEFQLWANDKHSEGFELLFVFSLKAFPEAGFNVSRSYPDKKTGSLSQ